MVNLYILGHDYYEIRIIEFNFSLKKTVTIKTRKDFFLQRRLSRSQRWSNKTLFSQTVITSSLNVYLSGKPNEISCCKSLIDLIASQIGSNFIPCKCIYIYISTYKMKILNRFEFFFFIHLIS